MSGARDSGSGSAVELWQRFRAWRVDVPGVGISVDVSRVRLPARSLPDMAPALSSGLAAMARLEQGAIANPDENRMVGHYWLRAPERAPTADIRTAVEQAQTAVRHFAQDVRAGVVMGSGGSFRHVLHIGIGGSALGPQLVCAALARRDCGLEIHFLDNADPDGVRAALDRLTPELDRTLVSVVSKSGWTPTPMHVLREVRAAYDAARLPFPKHAVATTMPASALDRLAAQESWLARFPLWDWVGGRTSVTSAVGLLPLALHGGDVEGLLAGARIMDEATRTSDLQRNPAVLLALSWYWLTGGRGRRNMVVLPYRDRLGLLPRYVQQLVMESIGKELDRHGGVVHQGLTVYGNKGSTDQHAFVQQLHEGPDDFFVVFVLALRDDSEPRTDGPSGTATLGDFLFGYAAAARNSLYERGRDSITICVPRVDAEAMGALIALFERAVGLYAELVDVNAYHQPSVDKDAAGAIVALQDDLLSWMAMNRPCAAEAIAAAVGRPADAETVYRLLERLALDGRRGVRRWPNPSGSGFDDLFGMA
jgi:glucose-6-phosphate isomerase